MAELRSFRKSPIEIDCNSGDVDADSKISSLALQRASICAYNQTRERFISNQVEVADFPLEILEACLANLEKKAGAALWISPFRDLPVTTVRFPVDLVFLDQDCIVIDTVESFPIAASRLPQGVIPASTLVFPGRALSLAAIQNGDRMILCEPEDMGRRLRKQSEAMQPSVLVDVDKSSSVPTLWETPGTENLMKESDRNAPKTEDQRNGDLVADEVNPGPALSAADPATIDSAADANDGQSSVPFSKKRSWWKRFLAGEPPDPRKSDRENIPGLIAYFFTGGAPVPHNVRDISSSGLYVITDERWYPNTVVRVTLSDQSEPTRETSLTLHARVARKGRDGVGLQFLLFDQKDVARGNVPPDLDLIVSPAQFKDFVRKFKTTRG